MKLRNRSLTGLAVLTAGLLAGSTVAHALTTEVRVVSALDYYDTNGNGWSSAVAGSGEFEIGSAYGAPPRLGGEALMFDTPSDLDMVAIWALTAWETVNPAFPVAITASPDLELGFWLYLSSASTAVSSPTLYGVVGPGDIRFDPITNGYTDLDTWMYVDTTDPKAIWTVRDVSQGTSQEMTWDGIVDLTRYDYDGEVYWATLTQRISFSQGTPGTYAAIDGVTVGYGDTVTVVDFELAPSSARPVLDDCKNDGWQTHLDGPFKNQGACIAAIVATN